MMTLALLSLMLATTSPFFRPPGQACPRARFVVPFSRGSLRAGRLLRWNSPGHFAACKRQLRACARLASWELLDLEYKVVPCCLWQ